MSGGLNWIWDKSCQWCCYSPSSLVEFNEVHTLPNAPSNWEKLAYGKAPVMDCLCSCKYGRRSSSALHSSLLASSSLNCPTESGTDDWAEPGGLEGQGGGGKLQRQKAGEGSHWPGRRELPGLETEQPQIVCRICSVDYVWTNGSDYRDFSGPRKAHLSKLPR